MKLKLKDLNEGESLYVKNSKTPISLIKKTRNKVHFCNSINLKGYEELHLVYYTSYAIYVWKVKPIKIKQNKLIFKANEINTSRINKRQAPRIITNDKDIEVSIYRFKKENQTIRDKLIKAGNVVNLPNLKGELVTTAKLLDLSELGMRIESSEILETNETYVMQFKTDKTLEVISRILYRTKGILIKISSRWSHTLRHVIFFFVSSLFIGFPHRRMILTKECRGGSNAASPCVSFSKYY